jgi:hypothetical protein
VATRKAKVAEMRPRRWFERLIEFLAEHHERALIRRRLSRYVALRG